MREGPPQYRPALAGVRPQRRLSRRPHGGARPRPPPAGGSGGVACGVAGRSATVALTEMFGSTLVEICALVL